MLQQVVRHLVSKGIFEEPAAGQFVLNEAARGLLDPGPPDWPRPRRHRRADGTCLEHSPDARADRAAAYQDRFGLPFWEDLDTHPEIGASFDALMGIVGHGTPDPAILLDGDWASVRSVVDVGGGTGALLVEILKAHPVIRGTLVDLPRVAARSSETFAAAGVGDRVTAVGQSFFDPLPAGADLYVLAKVLSDWPDREATALLTRCAEAARPSGRVVILGGVSPDATRGGLVIETVLLGGRERSLPEFTALAGQAGLVISATGQSVSGRFVVECRPPT